MRAADKKALGVSETICEADGLLIHTQSLRLVRWAAHFQAQFCWPSASVIPASVWWPVITHPPNEAEILGLGRHKVPDSGGLSSALFNLGRMELVREIQMLFSKT